MRANRVPGFAAGGRVTERALRGAAAARDLPKVEPWVMGNLRDFERMEETKFMQASIKRWRAMFGNGAAIVNYAMKWLHKIPTWGGTAVPGGATAPGSPGRSMSISVSMCRGRRSSRGVGAAQFPGTGSPGVYHSPPGGTDPGHVAIVKDAQTVISQGGGMGPILMACQDAAAVHRHPPGGSARRASGGSTPGTMSAGAIASPWRRLAPQYGYAANNMARIAWAEVGGPAHGQADGMPQG